MDYEQERSRWLELLTGEDRNSIRIQLCALSWDLAGFEIIGEAIKLAPRTKEGSPEFPPLVFNLIRVGFYANFFVSLRRITDDDERSVSLVTVLSDMKRNASCLTRAAMLSAEGIPYDYLPAKRQQEHLLAESILKNSGGICVPPALDWERFAERHAKLDRLMGVTPEGRQPTNAIPGRVFSKLIKRIKRSAKEATNYTNKFIAHSEAPGPERLQVEQTQITHGKLVDCCRCLCQVFNFVRGEILGTGSGPLLALPSGDYVDFLDRPIASAETKAQLRRKWDDMFDASLVESSWSIDDYETEFGNSPGRLETH